MKRIKIQYALIAYQELTAAERKMDLWQAHLTERVKTLDDSEIVEFNKRIGLTSHPNQADALRERFRRGRTTDGAEEHTDNPSP